MYQKVLLSNNIVQHNALTDTEVESTFGYGNEFAFQKKSLHRCNVSILWLMISPVDGVPWEADQ